MVGKTNETQLERSIDEINDETLKGEYRLLKEYENRFTSLVEKHNNNIGTNKNDYINGINLIKKNYDRLYERICIYLNIYYEMNSCDNKLLVFKNLCDRNFFKFLQKEEFHSLSCYLLKLYNELEYNEFIDALIKLKYIKVEYSKNPIFSYETGRRMVKLSTNYINSEGQQIINIYDKLSLEEKRDYKWREFNTISLDKNSMIFVKKLVNNKNKYVS